ncbi:GyrI-like domain-containing protein [Microbacterium sp. C5A9]|uniref:GyrI-like domain-containing protein n=1 Tax=Microbacterium sp. C5A9 TaxID=2736663 RepID=UPI001F5270BF|nr:GyrI-like domain-containing protein [Microbacterium sp. C5A9]MCI1018616.1 GyrI-like domain-containing protein [Microbacterium sp. C5A9]
MSALEITEKPLPFVRLATLTEKVGTQPEVAAVVGPLFDRVADALLAAGATPGLPIAEYDMDAHGVRITVGFAYDGPAIDGLVIVELPAVESAFAATHHGSMATIDDSWGAVNAAIIERGATAVGPCREVYLQSESDDQADWITELQQPVARA